MATSPGPPHAPLLLIDKIAQQAKILFFGSCALKPQLAQPGEVPVFLQMWDINDIRFGVPETRDRAMVLPDGDSFPGFDTNTTDLKYAAAIWAKIIEDLTINKMNIFDAVKDANQKVTADTRQPKFMVLGNPSVKVN